MLNEDNKSAIPTKHFLKKVIRKLSLKMVNSKPYVSVSVTFKEVQTTFEARLILSSAYGKNDTNRTREPLHSGYQHTQQGAKETENNIWKIGEHKTHIMITPPPFFPNVYMLFPVCYIVHS